MRVICIQQFSAAVAGRLAQEGIGIPEVGSPYNATGTKMHSGETFFILQEFPHDCFWISEAFATLPEATAEEMEAEVKEAILM